MSLITIIASVTRTIQRRYADRPIRGLTRFSTFFKRWPYQGSVKLGDIRMVLDTSFPAERWLLFSGNYQPAVTAILKRYTKPGDYCLDVGANLGFYSLKFAHWVGANGRVAAFEANPAMVKRIKTNIAANQFTNVSVVEQAVSDQAGQIEFYVDADPGKSSVRPTQNGQKISVRALTLDDYLRDWPRLNVIKMDIEGNDCFGIIGGERSIKRFKPFIVFEFTFDTAPTIVTKALNILTEAGYTVKRLNVTGEIVPFDYSTIDPTSHKHIDLMCIPPTTIS